MRRLLSLVSAIVFLDTSFFAVVAPLLPHYADTLGLSKASAGVLVAAYPAGTLCGALPSGLLVGRLGPRTVVVSGLLVIVGTSIGFALASSVAVLDVLRLAQGAGGACTWAGGLAWIVAEAAPERRGEMIGAALGAGIGGALVGPALGGAALAVGAGPVFGAVAAAALALACIAATTPVARHVAIHGTALTVAVRASPVRTAMWLVAVPGLGFGVLDVLFPLHLHRLGSSQGTVVLAFLMAAAAEGAMSPLMGRLSDRWGALVPIRAGLLASAVLLLANPASPRVAVAIVALVATTAALGTFWAPAMTLLSQAAERAGLAQGPAFGLVNLAWASGMAVGSAGGGALARATADIVPIAVLSALCAATLALVARRPVAAVV